eukprot:SAG11_NODE_4673_length_1812_cov_1.518389_2_plen_181_part_00
MIRLSRPFENGRVWKSAASMPRHAIGHNVLALCSSLVGLASGQTCPGFTVVRDTGVRGQAFAAEREISSAADCCAACTQTKGCEAWELQAASIATPPTCRLKGAVGATYNCSLCPFSGFVPPPPPAPAPTCPPARPRPPPPASGGVGKPAGIQGTRPHLIFFLQDDLGHDDGASSNPSSC